MTVSVKKFKKGDTVLVLAGKDKGRRGKVLRVLPREQKIVVENLNLVKRHTRPTNEPRGHHRAPCAVPISRSGGLLSPQPTRVGIAEKEPGSS